MSVLEHKKVTHRKSNKTIHEIAYVAAKNFLEKGFTNTSAKSICSELNISPGNMTFYYPTKEHILLAITKVITEFHTITIESAKEKYHDNLFAYCLEITLQIVLCEQNEIIRDIYLAIYTNPMTMRFVKEWTAEKNFNLLKDRLPDWPIERFRRAERVNCCIERSALTEPCTEDYPVEDKIRLILTCLLKILDIPQTDRKRVINQVLESNYSEILDNGFNQFKEYILSRLQRDIDNAVQDG